MSVDREPRGAILLVAGGVVVLLVAGSLLVVAAVSGLLPGTADCEVEVGDRTVELSTAEAEIAATVSASGVRQGLGLTATAAAVAEAADLPDADAEVVASALTGRAHHALACTHGGGGDEEADGLGASGLTARAERVRRDLDEAFGRQPVGGFAPGGVRTGHMPGSAHYEGRAVDVFVRPISPRNKTKGWAMAQYLVANADRLDVETVIFDARIWTVRRAGQGWRDYAPDTSGRSRSVARILEHRDHVHVDVTD
ncbi:MAG: hypothetical protein ABWY19_00785 [Marmoricola sp.]